MTAKETFKSVLEVLGFANYKPDQMTNSDYWMCTCGAMEQYALQENEKIIKENEELNKLSKETIGFAKDCSEKMKAMEANSMFWERRYEELKMAACSLQRSVNCETGYIDASVDFIKVLQDHNELKSPNDYESLQSKYEKIKQHAEEMAKAIEAYFNGTEPEQDNYFGYVLTKYRQGINLKNKDNE